MTNLTKKANTFWGVPFPDDLQAFHVFACKNSKLLEALELVVAGPLAFLARGKSPEEARFYDDPPEFVTVLSGLMDGLHWGYWFDAPGELEPVVVSYFANDAFELSAHGTSLFEAVREHLEALHHDAEQYLIEDPDAADDYRARLESYARARVALEKSFPLKRKEVGQKYLDRYRYKRKFIAPTRSRIGVVVPPKQYRPLEKKDPFERWNYKPTAAQVKRMVEKVELPGTALKLGHDLWTAQEHRAASVALLDRAYGQLGRDVLSSQLKKATAWRARCDARKEQKNNPAR